MVGVRVSVSSFRDSFSVFMRAQHSITPSQPFGTVTTAFNKRHFVNKNYESK